jgi:hypothetical protein
MLWGTRFAARNSSTRLMSKFIAGFRMPVLSIKASYPVLTLTLNDPGTGSSETTIIYPPPHPEYMAPAYRD